ncbi:MAG: efflux RND transporter periplasmic adaptor subunit [Thermoanaerobaculaceae bacterium]
MRKWVVVALVVGLVAAVTYAFVSRRNENSVNYRFVTVERGNLESVVSATGTLSAVKTVQVGTQTSGLIASLLVDFNDKVHEGQIIARLDTTLLESAVRDAEATAERAAAELRQAQRNLDRLTLLHQQGITSDSDFNTAQYNLDVARASAKSAEVAVARARENLGYATIKAPVSGTVVERDVDVGQTVAASLSAPKLFLIANDLSEMQILASVDESDIGQVKEGQTARFTVKAFSDRTFTGTVKQVRLQSATDNNVVSYTVVLKVANPDGILLPGMTATVEFITATASGVLKVANAALRFRPTETMLAQMRKPGTGAAPGAGAFQTQHGIGATAASSGGTASAVATDKSSEPAVLFYFDGQGELTPLLARTGISDGQSTEVSGPGLTAGMKVIAGSGTSTQTPSTTTNPFQSQQRGGPPGPPPGGF